MANLTRRSERGELGLRRFDPFRAFRDLMGWDPFAELELLGRGEGRLWMPDVEVKETKDALVFKVDLPGMSESDVEVSIVGNRLTISGKREEEKREEDERYFAYERSYGNFSRSFTLPEGCNPDAVDAELKGGVLTIKVP